MPNRISESILSVKSDREHLVKFRKDKETDRVSSQMETMPFLAIESDGSPFPQIIEARLETFVLQSKRLHDIMMDSGPLPEIAEQPQEAIPRPAPSFDKAPDFIWALSAEPVRVLNEGGNGGTK